MESDYFLPPLPEVNPSYEPPQEGNRSNPVLSEQWGFVNISSEEETTTSPNSTMICSNDYCVSDEEYVDMVIAYIFPTPYEWLLVASYCILFIGGLVGNFLVCFAVWRNHSMRTVTNYFIVNLAIADLLVVIICLPPTVLGDVTETWYLGSVMCKIVHYMQVGMHFNLSSFI